MTSSLAAAGPALRRTPPRAVLAFVSYALLTYFFLGVFVSERGLPGETSFVELSETRSALEGFLCCTFSRPLVAARRAPLLCRLPPTPHLG